MQGVKRGADDCGGARASGVGSRGCRCVTATKTNTLGGVGLFDAGDFRAIGVSVGRERAGGIWGARRSWGDWKRKR